MPRKSRNNPFDLPALELECMKTLWALGEATVEDIRAGLLPARPLAYTTVMTVMDRLAHKGLVERHKRGRAHVYTSQVPRESLREHAVKRLIENFFGGSREELRAHLSGSPESESIPAVAPTPLRARTAGRSPRKAGTPAPLQEIIDPSLL